MAADSVDDLLSHLRSRLERLHGQLMSDPRFREYVELETAIRVNEKTVAASSRQSRSRQKRSSDSPVLKAIMTIMMERGDPIPVRDLYQELLFRGIEVSGADPVRNLSSKLNYNEQFKSLGALGWVLNQPPEDETDSVSSIENREPH